MHTTLHDAHILPRPALRMPLRPLPPNPTPTIRRRPELLAPAGDREMARVALAAGANAVYFGLDEGFNARARATNLSLDTLDALVAEVHDAGARAYVTLNTLLFEVEIAPMERLLRRIAASGVDAIIVQDPAVCLIARYLCPELELHASTQMTISSAEGARFAKGLGVTRVVVPRELSVTEIARFAEQSDLELEVFIHGALCMSWSGQCLTSEAWGGRSANRGKCAQSCRMPYDLIVDGAERSLGDLKYLLSPKDLAGFRAIPALMEIGVHTLKIEGRLKGAPYVYSTVTGLQRWIDAVADGRGDDPDAQADSANDLAQMMVAYSRGFSDGFLGGADHQNLVDGRFPRHRGRLLGTVSDIDGRDVYVTRATDPQPLGVGDMMSPLPPLGGAPQASTGAPLGPPDVRPGVGVGFDAGKPEDQNEPGGPVFGVEQTRDGWRLTFGHVGPDLRRVQIGDRVWLTSDPELTRRAERARERGADGGQIAITLTCEGAEGMPLRLRAQAGGASADVQTDAALRPATGAGLDSELLTDKLGALGGTSYRLERLDLAALPAGLHVPVSQLKAARRAMVEALDAARTLRRPRAVATGPQAETLHARLWARVAPLRRDPPSTPQLIPLCRTDAQLDAAIAAGCREVELDWMELVGLGKAFARAKAAGCRVTIATVRVQKPGEEGFDRRIAKLEPDAILVRHWGGLMHFSDHRTGPEVHGDFSLNITNSLSAAHVLGHGLQTVTAAHDLDATQLFAMLDRMPAERLAVAVHHHISTFHTEHCVVSHTLSEGRDYRTCGRPCESHRVALRDHLGNEHPVIVDVGCRNTVFNAQAQSAASLVPELARRGVLRFRAEFVWESAEETTRVLDAYRALLEGAIAPSECVARVGVHEQFGVTAGTMRTLQDA